VRLVKEAVLSALIESTSLVNSSLDLQKVLRFILLSMENLIDAEASSVMILDEAARELSVYLALGKKGQRIQHLRLKVSHGIAGWVAREGKGIIVNNVKEDPRFYSGFDDLTGFETHSIICIPLKVRGKTIGVIELLNRKNRAPFRNEDLHLLSVFASHAALAWSNARQYTDLKTQHEALRSDVQSRHTLVLGQSLLIQATVQRAKKVALSDATVLLLGESGTGKEIFSRAIHNWSERANGPFLALNCVALSEELLESELFGHEKGSFTGAHQLRKGKLELADGGTVFLDEIGDMKPSLQVKLLRFLQEREFERVGGDDPIRTNVRIIAATNRNLKKRIEEGYFREDLFFRLNVVPIEIPPLRKRKEDIPELAQYFLSRFEAETKKNGLVFSPQVLASLTAYEWPGNVRELENTIERAVVLCSGKEIRPEDLSVTTGPEISSSSLLPFHESVAAHKKLILHDALKKGKGNRTEAARLLKLQPSYLSRLLRIFDIT
jgi:Nif-specific regulatory protein